ncbi:MAG: NAD(P)-dependent oxidoreductase [bacterium]|nr:NAD(P)-dependent oxidoreductase [bacterium]
MTDQPKRVLITGAAGFVCDILLTHWENRYSLRLADINPVKTPGSHEFVYADITDYDSVYRACEGIDTVIHLAADPSPSADFYRTLLSLNVVGAYNAFHAAAEAGCKRIVFASSVNAVLGYQGQEAVLPDVPIYPTNVYGATKCWGEALARVYMERLSCICVRLGSPRFSQNGDWNAEEPSMGISPRDTEQLFRCCVDAQNLPFAIVHGVSRHRKSWMDLEETCRLLKYEPQDGTAFPKMK